MVDRAWTIKEAIKAVTEANSIVRIRPGETPGDVRERVEFEAVELLRSLVALGLLKLDKPKIPSAGDRLSMAIAGIPMSERYVNRVRHAIEAAGLRVVEEKPDHGPDPKEGR